MKQIIQKAAPCTHHDEYWQQYVSVCKNVELARRVVFTNCIDFGLNTNFVSSFTINRLYQLLKFFLVQFSLVLHI